MTFDPMKFYEDGQRKQKRYDSLVPVFLVAAALLVGFYAFFVAYQWSHVKPRPVAPALVVPKPMHDTEITCPPSGNGTDEGCNTWRNQANYNVETDGNSIPASAGDVLEVNQPRRHKRKADELFAYAGHGGWHADPRYQVYSEWRFINTIPMEISCTKRTKTSGMQCESRPLTPAEIERYKPMAEKKKADCPRAPDGDGDYYVDSDGCLRVSFTPMPLTCGADEDCRWSVAHVTPDKPEVSIIQNPDGTCETVETWADVGHGGRTKRSPCACPKPDCKMPADVDVCPTQTLDPKAVDDKKAKP